MNTPDFHLTAPAEGCTSSSVLLLWNRPARAAPAAAYRIDMNGSLLDTCTATDYTVRSLSPGQSCTFRVTELLSDGREGLQTNTLTVTTQAAGPVVNVLDLSLIHI